MRRSVDLPPPPAHPELPPEVKIAGEEPIALTTADGLAIEALVRAPAGAARMVVLCHPHPLYGGTMHNAIVVVVSKLLAERGRDRVGTLRLNYRGVGKSQGAYGAGQSEVLDVRAAIGEAKRRAPGAALGVVGYSFGTQVGMRAAEREGGVERVCLIAPNHHVFRADEPELASFTGKKQIFVGSEDQFCTVPEAEAIARALHAPIAVIEGADHFFVRFRRELAGLVVPFIAPELVP
jgi:alpha/beta superfamily hydrolase